VIIDDTYFNEEGVIDDHSLHHTAIPGLVYNDSDERRVPSVAGAGCWTSAIFEGDVSLLAVAAIV
jgi:hypothetical protein